MKEKLQKMKENFNEALELLKKQNVSEEALAKFSSGIDALDEAEASLVSQEEEMTKTKQENESVKETMEKMQASMAEEMKKWADMYISAESVGKLIEDLKTAFKSDMAKMQEEIEKISNSPVPSKQMTKTVT
jgi:Zn-dependent peptidase ImmA (M78 family)